MTQRNLGSTLGRSENWQGNLLLPCGHGSDLVPPCFSERNIMQTLLFILNDGPYGTEKTFNAMRLAIDLKEQYENQVAIRLFFMSDSVTAALPQQRRSEGYNIQQMIEILIAQGAQIKLCKTCTNDRGITELGLIEGIQIGTLNELSQWTLEADKVLTF